MQVNEEHLNTQVISIPLNSILQLVKFQSLATNVAKCKIIILKFANFVYFWTRNWSPNAANLLLLVVVVVVRGRRSLKKP